MKRAAASDQSFSKTSRNINNKNNNRSVIRQSSQNDSLVISDDYKEIINQLENIGTLVSVIPDTEILPSDTAMQVTSINNPSRGLNQPSLRSNTFKGVTSVLSKSACNVDRQSLSPSSQLKKTPCEMINASQHSNSLTLDKRGIKRSLDSASHNKVLKVLPVEDTRLNNSTINSTSLHLLDQTEKPLEFFKQLKDVTLIPNGNLNINETQNTEHTHHVYSQVAITPCTNKQQSNNNRPSVGKIIQNGNYGNKMNGLFITENHNILTKKVSEQVSVRTPEINCKKPISKGTNKEIKLGNKKTTKPVTETDVIKIDQNNINGHLLGSSSNLTKVDCTKLNSKDINNIVTNSREKQIAKPDINSTVRPISQIIASDHVLVSSLNETKINDTKHGHIGINKPELISKKTVLPSTESKLMPITQNNINNGSEVKNVTGGVPNKKVIDLTPLLDGVSNGEEDVFIQIPLAQYLKTNHSKKAVQKSEKSTSKNVMKSGNAVKGNRVTKLSKKLCEKLGAEKCAPNESVSCQSNSSGQSIPHVQINHNKNIRMNSSERTRDQSNLSVLAEYKKVELNSVEIDINSRISSATKQMPTSSNLIVSKQSLNVNNISTVRPKSGNISSQKIVLPSTSNSSSNNSSTPEKHMSLANPLQPTLNENIISTVCPKSGNISSQKIVLPSTSNSSGNSISTPSSTNPLQPTLQNNCDSPTNRQQIRYSKSILSSPGKCFPSPKKRSSPTKRINSLSPYKKSNRFKSSPVSPFSQIQHYFPKASIQKNLFNNNNVKCSTGNILSDKTVNAKTASCQLFKNSSKIVTKSKELIRENKIMNKSDKTILLDKTVNAKNSTHHESLEDLVSDSQSSSVIVIDSQEPISENGISVKYPHKSMLSDKTTEAKTASCQESLRCKGLGSASRSLGSSVIGNRDSIRENEIIVNKIDDDVIVIDDSEEMPTNCTIEIKNEVKSSSVKDNGSNITQKTIINSKTLNSPNGSFIMIEDSTAPQEVRDEEDNIILTTQDIDAICGIVKNELLAKEREVVQSPSNTKKMIMEVEQQPSESNTTNEKTPNYCYNILFKVCDFVTQHIEHSGEDDLFSHYDNSIRETFFNKLPMSARNLYSRLFTRQYSWIRKTSMKYPEISEDLQKEIDVLNLHGFVTTDLISEELPVILELLSVSELKALSKVFRFPVTGTKAKLISSLINLVSTQRSISLDAGSSNPSTALKRQALKKIGSCAKLAENPRKSFLKYFRIFSLSFSKSVGVDLIKDVTDRFSNRFLFPNYIVKHVRTFRSIEDYNEYETSLELNAKLELAISQKCNQDVIEWGKAAKESFIRILEDTAKMDRIMCMPDFMRHFTAGHAYGHAIFKSVAAFKRSKPLLLDAVRLIECLLEQDIFLTTRRGAWYVELVTILYHHLKDYSAVVKYFIKAQEDAYVNSVSHNALQEQKLRMLNLKKVPPEIKQQLQNIKYPSIDIGNIQQMTCHAKSMPSSKPGYKQVYVYEGEEYKEYSYVEDVAAKYIKDTLNYTRDTRDEGRFLKSVLMACFWDVIFSIPCNENENVSVFINAFQTRPLDLGRSRFYERRKKVIQKRLKEMSTPNAIFSMVKQCCIDHEGTEVGNLIDWKYVSKTQLQYIEELIYCLPVKFMTATAEHLLKDYRSFSSGFPDLTLWNYNERKAIFVEVKGPNDTLSNIQKLWLHNIKQFGANASVCLVKGSLSDVPKRACGSNSKKRKSMDPFDSQEV